MEAIQIILSVIFGLLGLVLSISSVQKQKNRFWLGIAAILVSMGLFSSQIVILKKNSRDKLAEQQEFLRLKYSSILDDDKILRTIQSTPKDKILSLYLSPTNSTLGQSAKIRWIMLHCPKTLSNKYKVIDASNYGFQGITPLFPVISLLDNEKYYVGGVAVPETQFSPDNKVIVVTKHTNGLIEVESIDIEQHILPISTFGYRPINE